MYRAFRNKRPGALGRGRVPLRQKRADTASDPLSRRISRIRKLEPVVGVEPTTCCLRNYPLTGRGRAWPQETALECGSNTKVRDTLGRKRQLWTGRSITSCSAVYGRAFPPIVAPACSPFDITFGLYARPESAPAPLGSDRTGRTG